MTISRPSHVTIFRITFGLVWAIDAWFKWQPSFQKNFTDSIMMAAAGQPHWLSWWFDLWMNPLMNHAHLFAVLVALAETVLAIGLITGIVRRPLYIVGAVFAFFIWALGEGFGGPYGSDSTDIGAAVMYIFIFWALFLLDRQVLVWPKKTLKTSTPRKVES